MTQATKGTRWQRVPKGKTWTVTERWTAAGSVVWVRLVSDGGGAHRHELADTVEREWLATDAGAPPYTLRVTFGQQYHRQAHPTVTWAHPDGWFEVVLDPSTGLSGADYQRARAVVADVLGSAFAFDYDPQEWDRQGDDRSRWYPLGVLARVTVDSDGRRTWDVRHQFDQRMVDRG